jgi:hypothetical protein
MADDDNKQDLVNLATIARRVEAVTHIAERQRESISEIVKEAVALDMRVRSLEALAQTRAITEAREDERDKALYDRLTRIEEQIKDIRGLGGKVAWLIGSLLLTALVAFVIKGGLA